MQLHLLPGMFAICRLNARDALPQWALANRGFVSITRTEDELSIICPESALPAGVTSENGWRILKVAGPLDFALTGVVSSIAAPLADAGISIFAISTYDTDYVLVRDANRTAAVQVLLAEGHLLEPAAGL